VTNQLAILALAALALGNGSGCGPSSKGSGTGREGGAAAKLDGSGSTFIKPLMDKWADQFQSRGVQINYQGGGSGAGKKQMIERAVDFGCTDAFMTDPEIEKAKNARNGGAVLHVPLAMGGVVPAYNLPKEIDKPLRFTGEVLARIYLGQINQWDDPALKELNPDVRLPNLKIAPVHRSEPSGTTSIFTEFLNTTSPSWQASGKKFGTSISWPDGIGTGQNGSPGVINFVKNTEGGLCYVELSFALDSDVKFGAVQNKDNKFVLATPETVSKAAAGATIPEDFRFSLVNPQPGGEEAYPISGTTWAVLYVNQPTDKAKALVQFFTWAIHDGQKIAEQEKYAPLPESLVKRIEDKLKQIQSK
jgi:phosphate transport system substrate-binding protein